MSLSPFNQGAYGNYNTYAYFEQALQQQELQRNIQEKTAELRRQMEQVGENFDESATPTIDSNLDSPVRAYSKPATADLFKGLTFLG